MVEINICLQGCVLPIYKHVYLKCVSFGDLRETILDSNMYEEFWPPINLWNTRELKWVTISHDTWRVTTTYDV